MPSSQQDYLLRMMQQVAAAIARMLRRKNTGDLIGARQELHAAIGELLGPSAQVAPLMDTRTAAGLLSDPRMVVSWALLLRQDAELLHLTGHPVAAREIERRALELLLEARIRNVELSAEALADLHVLRTRVELTPLDPRYATALESVPEPPAPSA